MTEPDPAALAIVTTMLGNAGLTPTPDELSGLVGAYSAQAAGLAAMWAVPEARYESPALHFTATPRFADWAAS